MTEAIGQWAPQEKAPLDILRSVRLAEDGLTIELNGIRPADIATRLLEGERLLHQAGSTAAIYLPIALPLRGGRRLVVAGGRKTARPDPILIAALRKAHAMVDRENGMPVMHAAPVSPYERNILRLAFLAPDIQQDILKGLQPPALNLESLRHIAIPLAWTEQRKALGWDRFDGPCSGD